MEDKIKVCNICGRVMDEDMKDKFIPLDDIAPEFYMCPECTKRLHNLLYPEKRKNPGIMSCHE